MLAYSDFNMQDIGREKTAVFMIIHDEKKTYHSSMTIFIKQCYETLIDVAQENGGKLPFRTNFILDEFANMPPLKDVDSMVSAARSRDIRFTFIIQNFAQLNDVYGKEVAEIIKGNCGNLVYLISTELAALEEISKMCGEVKSKEKDKTASTPLVTVSDLQKLKLFQAIIIRLRMNPFKTKLEPDFKMDWGIKREEAPYPTREIKKIELFDLKKFVTEEKRKQMMNNLENNNATPNPFSSNFGNPFTTSGMMSPFASTQMPQSNPSMGASSSPFSSNPMFNKPMSSLSDMDIDQMMKDIDKRLKELDEEEERQKAQMRAQTKEVTPKPVEQPTMVEQIPKKQEEPIEELSSLESQPSNENMNSSINEEDKKIIEPKPETPSINNQNKPKINVDADSIIVNDNVITDDEFFDDFFNDEP